MAHRTAPATATICIVCCCLITTAQARQISAKIDEATARRLASEGEAGSSGDIPSLIYFDHLNRPFFEFYGISPPWAEGGYGYFAVNPWTGDVWALWGCRRLSTPALRKSQAAVRRRFTREELRQYARLRKLKPECIVED